MILNKFQFHKPENFEEAVRLISTLDSYKLLAGGTVLINRLKALKKKKLFCFDHVVSLNAITELGNICIDGDLLKIGATVTLKDIIDSDKIPIGMNALKQAADAIGTTPIRNMATIGGNIASRIVWTEMSCACVALGAQLIFVSVDGELKISAEEYFKNNAKSVGILKEIVFQIKNDQKSIYKRISKLSPVDVPLLSVCICLSKDGSVVNDIRVVINNQLKFSQRDNKIESFLMGKALTSELIEESIKSVDTSICDASMNEYKSHMFRVLVKQILGELSSAK